MDDSHLSSIYNYRRVSERVATGGQPTEEQLAAVAEAGCTTVINLGLHGTEYALPDERGLVESLGMQYIHVPVLWERPTMANLARFSKVMKGHQDQDLFVHCAANMRVSAFVALDRVTHQGWLAETALQQVDVASFPKVWQAFIDDVVREHTRNSR